MATKDTARDPTVPEDVGGDRSSAPAGAAPAGHPEPRASTGEPPDELETLLAEELTDDAFDLSFGADSPSDHSRVAPGAREPNPTAPAAQRPFEAVPSDEWAGFAVVPDDLFEADELVDTPIAAPDLGAPWEAGELTPSGTAAPSSGARERRERFAFLLDVPEPGVRDTVTPPDLGSPWESAELPAPAEPLPVPVAEAVEPTPEPPVLDVALAAPTIAEAAPQPVAVEAPVEEEIVAAPDLGSPWESAELPPPAEPLPVPVAEAVEPAPEPPVFEVALAAPTIAEAAPQPVGVEAPVEEEIVAAPDLGSPWASAELPPPAEPLPVPVAEAVEPTPEPPVFEVALAAPTIAEAAPQPVAVEAPIEEEIVAAPDLGSPWESAEFPPPAEPLPVPLAEAVEPAPEPPVFEVALAAPTIAEAAPQPVAVEAPVEEEIVAAPDLGSPWESAEFPPPAEPLPVPVAEAVEPTPEPPGLEVALAAPTIVETAPQPVAVEASIEEEIVAAPDLGSPWESAEFPPPAEPLPVPVAEAVEPAPEPPVFEVALAAPTIAEAAPQPVAVEAPVEEEIVAAPDLGSLWESTEFPPPAEPLPVPVAEAVAPAPEPPGLEVALAAPTIVETAPQPVAVEASIEEEIVAAPDLGSLWESAEFPAPAEPLPVPFAEEPEGSEPVEPIAAPPAFEEPASFEAPEPLPVPIAEEPETLKPIPPAAALPTFEQSPVALGEQEDLEEAFAPQGIDVARPGETGSTFDLGAGFGEPPAAMDPESASSLHEAPEIVPLEGEEFELPPESMPARPVPKLHLALPDEPLSAQPLDAGLLPEMDELEQLDELPAEIPHLERKPEVVHRKLQIGEMLLETGAIGQDQLEMALAEQRRTKNLLGEVLVNLGFASEDLVAKAVADQTGIPVAVVPKDPLPPELRKLIPEDIARKHRLLPLAVEGNELRLAMANPFDVLALDLIRSTTGLIPLPSIAPWGQILEAIERNFVQRESFDETFERLIAAAEARVGQDVDEDVTHGPLVELVDQLVVRAVEERATDIHIEPEEVVVRVRYRIDSILQPGPMIPKKLQNAIAARIKVMSGLNIAESRIPQDGRIRFGIKGRQIDLRVSTFLCNYGENIVLRVLDKASVVLSLDKLGFLPDDLLTFNRLIEKPHGIILVTGPTGSGKTTTLYAALSKLNTIDVNIMTIEDPIEYEINLIRQSQVNEKAGITFAGGLRAIMRQDPDVVLIGETRDEETASMATRAAMTGHLVFTTLHTNTATGAVSRIVDLDVEPLLVADTVIASIGQRLIRLVCQKCRTLVPAPPERIAELEAAAAREKMDWDGLVAEPKGCPACRFRGYHGRSGLFEIFEMTREAQDLVLHHRYGAELTRLARAQGMRTMYEDGLRRVLLKSCTLDEVDRVIESDKRAEAAEA